MGLLVRNPTLNQGARIQCFGLFSTLKKITSSKSLSQNILWDIAKLGLRIFNRMGKHFITQNSKNWKENAITEGGTLIVWLSRY